MKSRIKILVADNSYLMRRGLQSLINEVKDFLLVGEAERAEDLTGQLIRHNPDVLIIDYASRNFCLDDLAVIREHFPEVNILAITSMQSRAVISKSIDHGVISHLLKECDKEEIIESIYCTSKGQKFLCEKIVALLLGENKSTSPGLSCEGVKLSEREIQILQQIAGGLANKQIADKLFISTHTVTTHRKNLMGKLGINNTASLVMYAVRENLVDAAIAN